MLQAASAQLLTLKGSPSVFTTISKRNTTHSSNSWDGIPDEGLQRWYVSVILNRLMFIYFIQKKGFLNGDLDYLQHKSARVAEQLGADQYYRRVSLPAFL